MAKAKSLTMGLGEAIKRLVQLEMARSVGLVQKQSEAVSEREMIVQALNSYSLDLGFDCDLDDVPDNVSIFARSAKTSCCRLNNDTIKSTNRRS